MVTPLPNIWHLRIVGDASSKACYICYKPSTRVLITPDNKDHFYICPGHLKDKGFASPILDPEVEAKKAADAKRQAAIAEVVAEYEAKQKKKKEKRKDKEKDGKEEKDKKEEKAEKEDDDKAEKEKNDKACAIKSIETENQATPAEEDIPRVYALHNNFYKMRVDRLRSIEMAKKNQQRLSNPALFPSAPKNDLQ